MSKMLLVVLGTSLGCLLTGGVLAYATASPDPRGAGLEQAKPALSDPFSDADLELMVSAELDRQLVDLSTTR